MREALRQLESAGLVARPPGAKRMVVSRPEASKIASGMRHALVLHDVSFVDVWEAMMVIEPEVAALAAARRTQTDLATLTQISEAFAGLDRIRELMELPTERDRDARRERVETLRGDLEFEDVWFAYDVAHVASGSKALASAEPEWACPGFVLVRSARVPRDRLFDHTLILKQGSDMRRRQRRIPFHGLDLRSVVRSLARTETARRGRRP